MRSSGCAIIRRAASSGLRFITIVIINRKTAIMSSTPIVLLFVISIMVFPSITSVSLSLQNCKSDSECQSNSCCLLGASRYAIPTCMPFQQEGEQCRVNAETITTNLSYPDYSQIEVKNINFILCPCAEGLSCDSKNGICN